MANPPPALFRPWLWLCLPALWMASCQTARQPSGQPAAPRAAMTNSEYELAQMRALGCIEGEGVRARAFAGSAVEPRGRTALPPVVVSGERGSHHAVPPQPVLRTGMGAQPAAVSPSVSATRAVPVQRSGRTYYGPDGVSGQRVGRIMLNSDGTTGQVIGGTMFTR